MKHCHWRWNDAKEDGKIIHVDASVISDRHVSLGSNYDVAEGFTHRSDCSLAKREV